MKIGGMPGSERFLSKGYVTAVSVRDASGCPGDNQKFFTGLLPGKKFNAERRKSSRPNSPGQRSRIFSFSAVWTNRNAHACTPHGCAFSYLGAASPPCPKKLLKDTAAKREGENGTMSALEFVKKFDKKENCRRLCGRAPVPRWIKCLEVPAVQSLALRGGRFLDAGG